MWRMDIAFSDGHTQEFDLPLGEIVVGRAADCSLILEDESVSRQHAKITVSKVGVEIEDLQSSNGVVINGKQIADRILLQDGDEVLLGTVRLALKLFADEDRTLLVESMEEEEDTPGQVKPLPPKAESESKAKTKADAPQAGTGLAKSPAASGTATKRIEPAQPEPYAPKLVVYPDKQPKTTYQLSRDVINIGRSEENDVVIDHSSVSRFHAKITAQGQDYLLLDLDSANGTRVNSRAISRHKLRHGDEICFGSVQARFVNKSGNEATDPRPPAEKGLPQLRPAQIKIIIIVLLLTALMVAILLTR